MSHPAPFAVGLASSLLLMASLGMAQPAPAPPATVASPWAAQPRRLRLRPPPPPPAEDDADGQVPRTSRNDPEATGTGSRVLAEILGAVIGTGAGVGLGVGLTCVLPSQRDCADSGDVAWTMLAGAAFTMPVGVFTGGTLAGGRGTLGYTFLGALTGSLLSVPMVALADQFDNEGVGIAAALVFPVLGSILGFEWSAPARTTRPPRGEPVTRDTLWSVGVAPRGTHGALLGVGAQF